MSGCWIKVVLSAVLLAYGSLMCAQVVQGGQNVNGGQNADGGQNVTGGQNADGGQTFSGPQTVFGAHTVAESHPVVNTHTASNVQVTLAGPDTNFASSPAALRREWQAATTCGTQAAPVLDWTACLAQTPQPRLVVGTDLERSNNRGEAAPLRYRRQHTCYGPTDTLYFLEVYRRNRYWKVYRYRVANGKAVPQGPQWSFDHRGRATEVLHCETGQSTCRRWQALAYWPNDSLARMGWFLNGKPDSLHLSWYDQGSLRSRLHYRDGRLLQADGLWNAYGQPLETGGFAEGQGELLIYSLNGTPLEVRTYRDGRVVRREQRKKPR